MMALNSELQFSQGTIGTLKTSMKDVRLRLQPTVYMYVHVHVQCIYTCTCTTCVDDVVYMSVHYVHVHAYTCTCMHVYGIISFEQPQLVSQNQGLLEKNLSLQESSAEVTNPSVVKHVHVHVYAIVQLPIMLQFMGSTCTPYIHFVLLIHVQVYVVFL